MLDYRTLSLLDKINLNCNSGGYKVFLIKDLVSLMPTAFETDIQTLLEGLETLKNHQYISIKYQDDNEVCLMPLVKGRIESENKVNQEIEKMKCQKQYFFAGFFGAIVGGAIIGILLIILTLAGVK